MTESTERIAALKEVDSWFRGHGYGLVLTEEADGFWAHLFPLASLQIAAPKYGHGATPEEAAVSARHRYKVEEAVS